MNARYHYISAHLNGKAVFDNDQLASCSERHKVPLRVPELERCPDAALDAATDSTSGAVIEMLYGWPTRSQLLAASRILRRGKSVYLYWPNEAAVECVDRDRLVSYWLLWVFVRSYYFGIGAKERLWPYTASARRLARRLLSASHASSRTATQRAAEPWSTVVDRVKADVSALLSAARPVPLDLKCIDDSDASPRLRGMGIYLRTDFWAKIKTGGSYGHTCYVARALASCTERLVCFMPHRYELLDELGLHQVVVDAPASEASEGAFLMASEHYYSRLRPAFEAMRPAYIYERLCLGNYVGARLSRDFGIPYIVEYNGSEISMSRSFGGRGFVYEDAFLRVEEAAFRQATLISVVSAAVREDLIRRGIPSDKILVNPNGVEPEDYAPPTADEKAQLRQDLGIPDGAQVVGFTGTFGAWHGIDVLTEALPRICERAPTAAFLLIGDGAKKPLLDQAIVTHKLGGRVRAVGLVPQKEGARLLKACDIYVAPHSSHMVDNRFFGSPTKVFEYMAMGGGIVASNLEQIGEVLSPALRADDLDVNKGIGDARAVLCTPGNVNEFIDAVVFLVENPKIGERLGRNARSAAMAEYTWSHHVSRTIAFAAKRASLATISTPSLTSSSQSGPHDANIAKPILLATEAKARLDTGDAYKDEVQSQWNDNPCGSQYVKLARPHTLEWFLEAERYRYQEYAPWMAETMEFAAHRGEKLLEIGAGMGTDLAQFAKHGALVTDVDLSLGHLTLAQENFRLRGLTGRFVHQDAETLPFEENSFDVVYSNGVIHHTPNTSQLVDEIYRVLKPGGKAIIMVYAENSLHYWRNLVGWLGLKQGQLLNHSIGHIMSCSVEMTDTNSRPLVKVYSARRLHRMFNRFDRRSISQRQMTAAEVPSLMRRVPLPLLGKFLGWNLVLKAYKPR